MKDGVAQNAVIFVQKELMIPALLMEKRNATRIFMEKIVTHTAHHLKSTTVQVMEAKCVTRTIMENTVTYTVHHHLSTHV